MAVIQHEKQPETKPEMVGRITGTADCRWADPDYAPSGPAVPLGGKYALASGLIEIAYDSGAKVILQGPCIYEVESPRGGFLSLGKLTARVESVKPQAANPKSQIPNPKFAVRTPTAVVTDLGTEFGVEVSADRHNRVHVFRGRVAVRPAAGKTSKPDDLVLSEGQSAALDADGAVLESPPSREAKGKDSAARFVRRMPLPARLGVLDLLDIVAGGDGTGRLREQGIDPATGAKEVEFPRIEHQTDGHYHPVPWNRLMDGVFMPNGKLGPVQLDSAGHTYALPETSGTAPGSIWARGPDIAPERQTTDWGYWVYAMQRGGEYMPDNRGLLALHPNAGVTFDLAAICTAHPTVASPFRFRAFVGLANPLGTADVWLFADGRLKYRRAGLRQADGPVRIDLPLEADGRFLTLVSTGGDHGNQVPRCAWVVFGDPVLHVTLKSTDEPEKGDQPMNGP